MKQVIRSKLFQKQILSLLASEPHRKQKIIERIELFFVNRYHPILREHALVGKLKGYRSFSLAGDLRVLYREDEKYIYLEMIGTHNQVY